MKSTKTIITATAAALIAVAAVATPLARKDKTMQRLKDGTYVVNTTQIAKNVRGFNGQTPLKIYIKDGKILKVEPLANNETPGMFAKVKRGLIAKIIGMKVDDAAKITLDGVTGASYSGAAVKENITRGLSYYNKNKK